MQTQLDIADSLKKRRGRLALKRAFDVAVSGAALVALSPLFLVLALAVKLDSPGPVFYRQTRVGRGGKPFRIFKFRSMVDGADRRGPAITASGDPRITRTGAFLRRTKLDELAQLINVFLGQMSFVGPRPEVEQYVKLYTPYQRQVLLVRPGITDYASIAYRNESELLARADDPQRYYVETLMPAKIELNMKYLREISLAADLKLIFRTVAALAGGAQGEEEPHA